MTKLKQKTKKIIESFRQKIREEISESLKTILFFLAKYKVVSYKDIIFVLVNKILDIYNIKKSKLDKLISKFLISKTITTFVFVPLLSIPLGIYDNNVSSTELQNQNCYVAENCVFDNVDSKKQLEIAKIKQFMSDRSMPLADYAEDFVEISYKYGLDYNLLAAISIKESSGGKNMNRCVYNPFGWASCRVDFDNYQEAIETVASHLSGNDKKTSYYYAGKSNQEKLYNYNGTIIEGYEDAVIEIMNRIDTEYNPA